MRINEDRDFVGEMILSFFGVNLRERQRKRERERERDRKRDRERDKETEREMPISPTPVVLVFSVIINVTTKRGRVLK